MKAALWEKALSAWACPSQFKDLKPSSLNQSTLSFPAPESHSRAPPIQSAPVVKKASNPPKRAASVASAMESRGPQSPSSLALAHSSSEPPSKRQKKMKHKENTSFTSEHHKHQLTSSSHSSEEQDVILISACTPFPHRGSPIRRSNPVSGRTTTLSTSTALILYVTVLSSNSGLSTVLSNPSYLIFLYLVSSMIQVTLSAWKHGLLLCHMIWTLKMKGLWYPIIAPRSLGTVTR